MLLDQVVYLCGPRIMVNSFIKSIQKHHPGMPIDFEAFAFMGTLVEDGLSVLKKGLSFLFNRSKPKKPKS